MMKCYDWDTVAAKLGYKNQHDYQNMTMREICNATRLNSSQFYNVQRSNPFIYKRVRMK